MLNAAGVNVDKLQAYFGLNLYLMEKEVPHGREHWEKWYWTNKQALKHNERADSVYRVSPPKQLKNIDPYKKYFEKDK